jgi:hypothetical protein
MALVLNDRVKETTTTTGTGTINLGGAQTNFETFVAGIGDGNTTYYAIVHRSSAEFEIGLGTLTDASPDTLARTTIISSSNSDSAVNFSAGTKDVFCTMPASKAVHEDGSSDVTLPNDLILGSDSAILKFGADSDINITHVADTGLTTNGDFTVGDDLTVSGGVIDLKTNSGSRAQLKLYCESGNAHAQKLQAQPHSAGATNTLTLPDGSDQELVGTTATQTLTNKTITAPVLSGSSSAAGSILFKEDTDNGTNAVTLIGPASTADVTVTLPAATDTLVGKATTDTLTNKSIDSDNNTITNIVNADIKSSAAIADTKLATISTAGKVALTALEIDGGSDIGADLTTSDLIIVDDGAGGTNKKAALSRVVTLMSAQGFSTEDPTALAIALG